MRSILQANAFKPLESYEYNKEEINQVDISFNFVY